MGGGDDDVRRVGQLQGVAVEEDVAGVVDEVGGAADDALADEVALAVAARAVGVLPAVDAALGDADAVAEGVKCQCLLALSVGVADGQVVEGHVVGVDVDGGCLADVAVVVLVLVVGNDDAVAALAGQVDVGLRYLHVLVVRAGLNQYIVGSVLGGLLLGGGYGVGDGREVGLALRGNARGGGGTDDGVEDDAALHGLRRLVGREVDEPVGHAVEEHFEVGVSARREAVAVGGVGGVQSGGQLVVVGHAVTVGVQHQLLALVHAEPGPQTRLDGLAGSLVKGVELVVALQGDVGGRVDDACSGRGDVAVLRTGKAAAVELRILPSGSLGQQSAVHLVVAGQRGAGLLGDGKEGLVGGLILHAVQGVGQLVEQGLVGQRLRGRHRPEVHGA